MDQSNSHEHKKRVSDLEEFYSMTQYFKQLLRNWQKNLCEYYVLNNNHGSKNSIKKRKKKQIRYNKQE